jgi:putative ABC transport system permease protein
LWTREGSPGLNVLKMARRNVWRNTRRTCVTVGAMSLGLLVMILYASLVLGMIANMERDIVELEVGDIQIVAGDYRDNPSLWTRIEDPDAMVASLEEAGFRASGRLLAFGLAASDDSSAGASFRGVDVAGDARVSLVYQELFEGEWLDPADPKGVVMGRRLARSLGVGPGGELLVLSQGADGSLAYGLYRVRGVLNSIGDATDRSGVFMTEAAFRELMVVPEGVHQLIVRRPETLELPLAAGQVVNLAGAVQEGDLDIKTWKQLLPTLAQITESARSLIVVVFFIIYIAIAMLILNAMLMVVFERIREVGVLKALGVGPFQVFALILVEAAVQTGLALVIGVTLSLPALWYLSVYGLNLESLAGLTMMGIAFNPLWQAQVTAYTFTGPIFTMLAIVAIAVVYPAVKAALIRPVEAMRFN